MTTLSEFISQRKRELALARAEMLRQLHEIEAELMQLEQALAATAVQTPEKPTKSTTPTMQPSRARRRHSSPIEGTIKYMAIDALKKSPAGLTAQEILSEINLKNDQSYTRSSLSPQLSRLKSAGLIVDESGKWIYIGTSSS